MENTKTNLQERIQDIKARLEAKKAQAWAEMVKLEMSTLSLRELRLLAA